MNVLMNKWLISVFFYVFQSDLSQQGELLLQDSFQVWTESKKDIRLRLKTQQRHIFLYQKVMLLCKQGSKTGHNKSTYQYKHHVNVSDNLIISPG